MSTGGIEYDPSGQPDPAELRRRRSQAAGLRTGARADAGWRPDEPESEPAAGRVDRLLDQARRRMQPGSYQAAIALLNQATDLDPTNPEAYLLLARCYLALEHIDRALELLDIADKHAGSGDVHARIADARNACRRAATDALVEEARQRLRAGDPRRAVEILEGCAPLIGDEERFQEIRSYAYERLGRDPRPGTRVRRTPPDVVWLEPRALQGVLRWLTKEEWTTGEHAFREGKVKAAVGAFEAAARIDDRGTRVACMHALTLLEYVRAAFARQPPPDLDKARACLDHALRLARQAERDPALRERAGHVARDVDTYLRRLDEVHAHYGKVRAVTEVVRRYNAFVEHYQRDPPRYLVQRSNARSSLAQMHTQAMMLRREHAPDSPEGRVLADITERIENIQAQFR